MESTTVRGSKSAVEIYGRLKSVPSEKLLSEGRAALVRLSEERVRREREHFAESARRFEPVQHELISMVKSNPQLGKLVRSIDPRDEALSRARLPAVEKRRYVPAMPLVRQGSIHIVDALPFFSDTWTSQDGSGAFNMQPAANGASGDMGFDMVAGVSGSGHTACWAALGAQVAIPNAPCFIGFMAFPSYSWYYTECSNLWWRTSGNIWAGLYVALFNSDGSFLETAVDTQISVASFNDSNVDHWSSDSGSTSATTLTAATLVSSFPLLESYSAQGGFLQYWCWIGGSCNAANSDAVSRCVMTANCSNLTIDIFEQ